MKMKKELWFGFTIMAIIILASLILTPWTSLSNGHLGLLMLSLVVVAIMLGFPTAFTLMGMGMIFAFFAYWEANKGHAEKAGQLTLDLMVQKAYGVMTNEVLLSISAVRVHGLSGRTRQPDREIVQVSAPRAGTPAGLAGGRHARDLCDFCHGNGHCRCGGDADGAAGIAGNAACGL